MVLCFFSLEGQAGLRGETQRQEVPACPEKGYFGDNAEWTLRSGLVGFQGFPALPKQTDGARHGKSQPGNLSKNIQENNVSLFREMGADGPGGVRSCCRSSGAEATALGHLTTCQSFTVRLRSISVA